VPLDRVFGFEEVPSAIERVGGNEAVGKVVVKVRD
jgi:NADPH-dependent curcumin reductase CurA